MPKTSDQFLQLVQSMRILSGAELKDIRLHIEQGHVERLAAKVFGSLVEQAKDVRIPEPVRRALHHHVQAEVARKLIRAHVGPLELAGKDLTELPKNHPIIKTTNALGEIEAKHRKDLWRNLKDSEHEKQFQKMSKDPKFIKSLHRAFNSARRKAFKAGELG